MSEAPLILVYGTLRADCAGIALAEPGAEGRALIAAHGERVGRGMIAGRLLALDWYPGLVSGRGRVTGEIWRLSDAETVLADLDAYEGEYFQRGWALAMLDHGRKVRVQLWRYVGPRTGLAPIAGGDYRIWAECR